MMVVSYTDFFANPAQYKQAASLSGLKILPEKKKKKFPRRIQKKLEHLEAVIGILPDDIDEEAIKAERLSRQ
ncbi:MAG: hypothetical protein IJP90_12825 [Treponema sp.]|nr:hypothetical protein [Treponema sp.]